MNKFFLVTFISIFFIMLIGISFIYIQVSGRKTEIISEDIEEIFPAIRIFIYNGCGFQGVANRINEYLLDVNIDVVNTRNAQRFVHDKTLIVVKHDDEKDLQRLKNMTGIENIIYAVNSNFEVPFIIIAGKDYEKFFNVNNKLRN